ncbi:hypothetical protein [Oceanobacillus profundus]|nr:hypothetical protein [Oceanobacillus profundus]
MAEQDGCFIFVFGVLVRQMGALFLLLVSWRDGKAKKRRGSYQ